MLSFTPSPVSVQSSAKMVPSIPAIKSRYHHFLDITQTTDLFSQFVWALRCTAGVGLHRRNDRLQRNFFRCVWFVLALQQPVLLRDLVNVMRFNVEDHSIRIGMCLIYSTMCMLQMIALDVNYDRFVLVKDYLNRRHRGRCGGLDAERVRSDLYRQSGRNVLVVVIPIMLASLIWAFAAREDYMHFVADFGEHQWVVDGIDFFYGLPLVYWNNGSWIVSLAMLAVLKSCVHELTIIAELFSSVLEQAEKSVDASASDSEREHQFWTSFDRHFRSALTDYEEFLEMIAVLRKLTTMFFLLKVLTTESLLAVTCFTTFNLTYQVITALMYAIVFLVECFFLSRLVEHLHDQREAIGASLHHWKWPEWVQEGSNGAKLRLRHVRTMSMITEMHCQQTFRFRCGEMFDVSMEMFRMVVETCYSLLTFLQATKGT